MSGQIVRVFNKMTLDASKFTGTSTQYTLMKNIPAAQYRDFCFSLRVHTLTTALSAGTTITFGVFNASPTEEDPATEFWGAGSSGAASAISTVVLSNTNLSSTTTFVPFSLTCTNVVSSVWTPFAGYLTVAYQVVAATSTGVATVSGDLILKA